MSNLYLSVQPHGIEIRDKATRGTSDLVSTVTPDELLRLVRLLNQLEDEIETIKCNHRLALEQNE